MRSIFSPDLASTFDWDASSPAINHSQTSNPLTNSHNSTHSIPTQTSSTPLPPDNMSSKSQSKAFSSAKKSSSTASHSKSSPKYTTLPRTWPTDPASSNHQATATSQSITGMHQNVTSMQRWENETQQQSYYTGVAEYNASYTTTGDANRQAEGQEQTSGGVGGQHWSLTGDEESERWR